MNLQNILLFCILSQTTRNIIWNILLLVFVAYFDGTNNHGVVSGSKNKWRIEKTGRYYTRNSERKLQWWSMQSTQNCSTFLRLMAFSFLLLLGSTFFGRNNKLYGWFDGNAFFLFDTIAHSVGGRYGCHLWNCSCTISNSYARTIETIVWHLKQWILLFECHCSLINFNSWFNSWFISINKKVYFVLNNWTKRV